MTPFTIPKGSGVGSGVTIDLDRPQVDVLGWHWAWTGVMDETGMPLMHAEAAADLRLCFLYETLGPLIAVPLPVTAAEQRAVLTTPACTTTSQAAPVPTPRVMAWALGRRRRRSA